MISSPATPIGFAASVTVNASSVGAVAAPEPSTWVLMLMGSAGLAG
jgi:hypothetical protein